MYKAWNYLPQHMAGNYRQCVSNPSNETQFILIQPEVTEDDTANYTIGKLENPRREKYMSYDNEEDLKIYPTQEEEKEHENKKFSVISYWDFSATTNRTFDCTLWTFLQKPEFKGRGMFIIVP